MFFEYYFSYRKLEKIENKTDRIKFFLAQLEHSSIALFPPHISNKFKALIEEIHYCIFNIEQSIIKINNAQSQKDKNLQGLKLFYIYQFIKTRLILIKPLFIRFYYVLLNLFKKNKLKIERKIYACPICFKNYRLPYNKGLILLKCNKTNCKYNSYVNTNPVN